MKISFTFLYGFLLLVLTMPQHLFAHNGNGGSGKGHNNGPSTSYTVTPESQVVFQGNAYTTLTASPSPYLSWYSYQWQESDDTTTWNDISGATTYTYAPSGLPVGIKYYRCSITRLLKKYNTNIATVTTYAPIVIADPGYFYGDGAVTFYCSGVTGGNGVYTYQWQYSADNSTWFDINDAKSLSFSTLPTTSYYYRLKVTSTGLTLYSNSIYWEAYPQVEAGTITPSDYSINYNTSPGPLTSTPATGGDGNYSYQWHSSPDNYTWTDIADATSLTYTPPALTTTTYYMLSVPLYNARGRAYTNVVTVTVAPMLLGGTIGTTGTVSYNSSVTLNNQLVGTGGNCNGQYIYQWQQSFDGGTWYDISGANTTTYVATNLTEPVYYFRRQLTCGTETVWSNIITITVTPELFPGTITPDYINITAGTSPGELIATAATGGNCTSYSYQWQSSTDNSTWTDISDATFQNYTPGAISVTTYYRRIVTCGNSSTTTNVCVVSVGASTSCTVNYIRERAFLQPGITDKTTADAVTALRSVKQTTKYFDGLGRLIQTVNKQGNPDAKDVVAPVVYDAIGRESEHYLPYVAEATDGNYRCTPVPEQKSFNASLFPDEKYYYGRTDYEASPLQRINKVYSVGNNWVGSNRGIASKYLTNTVIDDVKMWTVNDVAGSFGNYVTQAGTTGGYAAGQLYKDISADENGHQVIMFKDKNGNVVLKKVQSSETVVDNGEGRGYTGWLCTYYIYDDLNNLRCVVQPQGVALLINNQWDITALDGNILDEQCFRYEYDHRDRVVMKKTPGAVAAYMIYDNHDRLVLHQDGNMRKLGQWFVSLYDNMNRPVQTGMWTNSQSLTDHIAAAKSSANDYYPFNESTVPASGWEMLSQTHYDDYTNIPSGLTAGLYSSGYSTYFDAAATDYPEALTEAPSSKGMVTWTKMKVLGQSKYISSCNIYDEKDRVIQMQTLNYSGALDVITYQYGFSGLVLRNHVKHQVVSGTTQSYELATKYNYDDGTRMTGIEKNLNGSGWKPINALTYNLLGQLNSKTVAPAYSSAGLETFNYDYNIRGWLLGLNREYSKNTTDNSHYFGFDLGYDQQTIGSLGGYAGAQYNGNIAGTVWKSQGDQQIRKYDFSYDAVNRLTGADFNQYNSGFNKNDKVDFSVSNLTYDANGNILTMDQKGLKVSGSDYIDKLRYTYLKNGNRLQNVMDITNDPDTKLADFRYSAQHDQKATKDAYAQNQTAVDATTVTDYAYDENGNLDIDKNKNISAISYNILNLAQTVTVTNKGTITYVYDAAGIKWQKIVSEPNASVSYKGASYTSDITTTTNYLGGFVYENKVYSNTALSELGYTDRLQYIAHEEGRIRYIAAEGTTAAHFEYDYFVKDHLGNVRMVLTEEQKQDIYPAATLEGSLANSTDAVYTESQYYSINEANIVNKSDVLGITDYKNKNGGDAATDPPVNPNPNSNVTANSAKLYKLKATGAANGGVTGLGMTLKVTSGDYIDVYGKSYYNLNNTDGSNNDIPVESILTGLFGAPGSAAGLKGATAGDVGGQTALTSLISDYLGNSDRDEGNTSTPKAYINWILFDENFKYIKGGFDRVWDANDPNAHTVKSHTLSNISVTKNGYLYVYCSNESPVDVYFDNLQVIHTRGPILEETHYYPFGLTMAGISSKALASGYVENKKQFNGIEHTTDLDLNQYDAFYRTLDPQIGRFWQIDPEGDILESYSPFESMGNNPVNNIDPLGDFRTRFGAWLNKVFNGGQAVRKNEFGEWYVVKTKTGTDADGNPTITASRYYGKGRNQYSSAGEKRQSEQENKEFVDRLVNKGVLVRTTSLQEANDNNLRAFVGVLLPNVLKVRTIKINLLKIQQVENIVEKIKITFGKNANQIYHTFRHTDEMGLAREAVQTAVEEHLPTIASQIVDGKPLNQVIEVSGQKIQYTAYKLSDGTINVGRIHGVN